MGAALWSLDEYLVFVKSLSAAWSKEQEFDEVTSSKVFDRFYQVVSFKDVLARDTARLYDSWYPVAFAAVKVDA